MCVQHRFYVTSIHGHVGVVDILVLRVHQLLGSCERELHRPNTRYLLVAGEGGIVSLGLVLWLDALRACALVALNTLFFFNLLFILLLVGVPLVYLRCDLLTCILTALLDIVFIWSRPVQDTGRGGCAFSKEPEALMTDINTRSVIKHNVVSIHGGQTYLFHLLMLTGVEEVDDKGLFVDDTVAVLFLDFFHDCPPPQGEVLYGPTSQMIVFLVDDLLERGFEVAPWNPVSLHSGVGQNASFIQGSLFNLEFESILLLTLLLIAHLQCALSEKILVLTIYCK